jgi:hypothetical protein
MSKALEQFLSSLDEIGGEPRIGSGLENEISESIPASFAEGSIASLQRATREGDEYEQ